MAHKRKKRRTQMPYQPNGNAVAKGVTRTNPADRTPRSMVIRMGGSKVGPGVTQLVKDVRNVMEPHTASRLKERRKNSLRDYTTMAAPFGISHFLLFYRSKAGLTNMKVAISPKGPTLSFHVEKYSLAKDVTKAQRRPKQGGAGKDHLTPPLLVMNNIPTNPPSNDTSTQNPQEQPPPIPKHLESLTASVFKSLFPLNSPQKTRLPSIRRVLLLNRELPSPERDSPSENDYILNFRHYAITTRPVLSLSRGFKKLHRATTHATYRPQKPQDPDYTPTDPTPTSNGAAKRRAAKGALPDLSHLDDVADFIIGREDGGSGYTSAAGASDTESQFSTDAEVEVVEARTKKVLSRREREAMVEERRARDAAARQQRERRMREEQKRDAEVDVEGGGEHGRKEAWQMPEAPEARMQKKGIKLTELGPRMRLRLYKVEEGLCSGKTLWHGVEAQRSAEDERKLDEKWEVKHKEREERRMAQKERVEMKKKEKGEKAKVNGEKTDQNRGQDEEDDEMDEVDWEDEDLLDGMDLDEEEDDVEE